MRVGSIPTLCIFLFILNHNIIILIQYLQLIFIIKFIEMNKIFGKFGNFTYAVPFLFVLPFAGSFFYSVDIGHYALKFNKLTGLQSQVYREGWNLKLPYFQRPIIFNVQSRQKQIMAETANRQMQNVKLTVRILFHPQVDKLHQIYTHLGPDYDRKVLPAIVNEITRSIIAQFSATQLLSQRDQVSDKIRSALSERAKNFWIKIDNLAITELTFGKQYLDSIQAKQVAQQEAERAKYEVQQARQTKKSIIIKAQAEAKSIELVGSAAMNNPSYLDVRRIQYSKQISSIISESKNHILLNSSILQMNSGGIRAGQNLGVKIDEQVVINQQKKKK